MKSFIVAALLLMLAASRGTAQESRVVESTFAAAGNCSQCKTRIEQSLKIKEVKFVRWNRKEKRVTVAYLSPSISLDSLQHRVALAGHDTEPYKTSDETYATLPECCLYRTPGTEH